MKYFYIFLGMIIANLVALFLFSCFSDMGDECEHSAYDVREESYPQQEMFLTENLLGGGN